MPLRVFTASEKGAVSLSDIGLPVGLIGLFAVLSSGVIDPVPERGNPPYAVTDTSAQVLFAPGPEDGSQTGPLPSLNAAPVRVRSDFAGALNGWTFGRGEAVSQLEHRLGAGSDRMQGFLRFHDGDSGKTAYLKMPSVHIGDQSALFGGTISFAFRIFAGGDWIGPRPPLIRLTGANGRSLTYSYDIPPERKVWNSVKISVQPRGWRIDGKPATEAGMRAILSDVAMGELRIEHCHGGGEVIDLDTVEFEGDYGMYSMTP